MTLDEVINLARAAGYFLYDLTETHGIKTVETDEVDQWSQLERFAALVAAAEREKNKKLWESLQFSDEKIANCIEAAVAAEREACAKVCEDATSGSKTLALVGIGFADAIRARNNQ